MTVQYQVPVADALLLERDTWRSITGLRLISVDGIWPQHPHVTLCTFEDDGAGPELAGKLVEPVIQTDHEGDCGRVIDRVVIGGAGAGAR